VGLPAQRGERGVVMLGFVNREREREREREDGERNEKVVRVADRGLWTSQAGRCSGLIDAGEKECF